ncbi:DUF1684 domain-containing protein [Epilithonimonas mollis]|uniref:DUF1684 domain-containing protein n=1 Tax=Epilithonimonas mollis TaxID=216903 RepID=A0A1M6NSD4_9FLAO|nr:DUF1684 domain-containing protein [Epilithonimonas mollis]SHJ98566.1 hypothetical protein SAMN05444371_0610 [Epilithonimonas mollis]
MKKLTLLFLLLSLSMTAQTENEAVAAIKNFQKELNDEYLNPKESPLRGNNLKDFKKHPFFPVNLKYRLIADFIKTTDAKPIDFPTSSGQFQKYLEFGRATFVLDGKSYTLTIYQNVRLSGKSGYEDYLFLPFRDETNGKETYGGGKYIDLRIPQDDKITIDFNQSYQPFCAYNAYDYSCPIVPEENTLPVKIEAGVMYDDVYHH